MSATIAEPGVTVTGSRAQILLFLALLAVPWALLNLMLVRTGGLGNPDAMPIVAAIMWLPALAAIVTRGVTARTLRGLGWGLGNPHYLLVGYMLPLLIAVTSFAITLAVGAGDLTLEFWPRAAGHLGLPATPLTGFVMLATVNVLFATIGGLGEEIGWRGFLVPALAGRLRFRTVVGLSWALWFIYHLPAMLGAGYHSGTPLWFALPCFALMLLGSSAYLAWLRLESRSIWPCALAHGAHNAFLQEMFASALEPDGTSSWIFGEFGAATALVTLAIAALTLRLGSKRSTRIGPTERNAMPGRRPAVALKSIRSERQQPRS